MRNVIAAAGLVLAAPALLAAQPPAPNGEAVYRQHCAGCHETSMPRLPSRDALRAVTPEAIETALSSFTMRRQGAALTRRNVGPSPSFCQDGLRARTGRRSKSFRRALTVRVHLDR